MTSFLCPAVVFCASPKMVHICARSVVEGPSSGMTTVGEDIRDAVDAREPRVGTDDLRDSREAAEVRVETRPGMVEDFGVVATFQ